MTEEAWIESNTSRLFARRWHPRTVRSDAALVLLHDSLGCVELWRDFPRSLAEATGREVIAYDRLGFGRSAAHPHRLNSCFIAAEAHDGFAATIRHFHLNRFAVLGHSVGGAMAAHCAAASAGHCQALITLSAQAFVEERTLQGICSARQSFSQPEQLARLERYHGDRATWVLDAWVNSWLADEFRDWCLDAVLPQVQCPLLAIHGNEDEYGSLRHPERITALAAGPAETLVLPCGHLPHREQPERVLEAIADFLARYSG